MGIRGNAGLLSMPFDVRIGETDSVAVSRPSHSRRLLLVIAVVGALVLSLPSPALAVYGYGNLLPTSGELLSNPSFSNGTNGWTAWPSSQGDQTMLTSVDDPNAPNQSSNPNAVKVTWSGNTSDTLYVLDSNDYVTSQAGYLYTATAFVQSTAQTAYQPITIVAREWHNGQTVALAQSAISFLPSGAAYAPITVSFTAKYSGDYVDTYVGRTPPYQSTGEAFYVSDYSLIGTAPAYIPANHLNSNPSFETFSQGTNGWTGYESALTRVADSSAPDGSYSAQVSWNPADPPSNGYAIHSNDYITTQAGQSYTATAWVKAANSATNGLTAFAEIRERNGSNTVQLINAPSITLTQSGYQELTVSLTAQNTGDVLDASAWRTQSTQVSGDSFYADAFTIAPTTNASCPGFTGNFSASNPPTACWRPYSDTSFVNTPIVDNPPVVSDSATLINDLLNGAASDLGWDNGQGSGAQQPTQMGSSWQQTPTVPDGYIDPHVDAGRPVFWSKTADPSYTIVCTPAGPICDTKTMSTVRIPQGAVPEGFFSGNNYPNGSTFNHDGVMTVVAPQADQYGNNEYDFWQVSSIGRRCDPSPGSTCTVNSNGTCTPHPSSATCAVVGTPGKIVVQADAAGSITGSAVGGGGNNYGAPTAGGMMQRAGVIRSQELAAATAANPDTIHHALYMSVPCEASDPNDDNGADPVPPLNVYGAADNLCSSSMPQTHPHGMPMGSHLQLNMTDGQIENLPSALIPPWEKAIMLAMAKYGGYVDDSTGSPALWGFDTEGDTSTTSFNGGSQAGPLYAFEQSFFGSTPGPESYGGSGNAAVDYFSDYCPGSSPAINPFPSQPNRTCSSPIGDSFYLDLSNVDWTKLQVLQPGY